MKIKLFIFQITSLLFIAPLLSFESPPDFTRTICSVKNNMELFPQMIVQDFLEKNKGHETSVLELVAKVKELMNEDKYYLGVMDAFNDLSLDEMDLYMALVRSNFMKKVRVAEQNMKDLNLPTYEKELFMMVNEKNINNID